MRNWGLSHNIFSLPVSGFISSAAQLRLQLKLRMWYQAADSLSSWTDQNYWWGRFLWGLKPFLWESTTCYTHLLLAANTPDSRFLSLNYHIVQRLRLDIWNFECMGEGKTKTSPKFRQIIYVKRIFSYVQHTKEWWQKTRRVLLSAKALLNMAFLTNAMVLQSFLSNTWKIN